ncbi:hypothetical protein AGMMS49938_18150 [Fibrobacterales bacterium]|nr:hypothetical protein AGMMS49938_18150 [Fibrobacterales bacterium]
MEIANLLNKKMFRELFDGKIKTERFLLLPKSYIGISSVSLSML